MERIRKIEQLTKGDKIVKIEEDNVIILEFREIHPYCHFYSLMLSNTSDGMPKFHNKKLEEEEWYRFNDTKEDWKEIHQKIIDNLQEMIKYYQNEINLYG